MKFRVEAYVGIIGKERYRLQENGSWRKIKSFLDKNHLEFDPRDSFSLEDRLFDNLEETRPYLLREGEIELGGKVYSILSKERDTVFESFLGSVVIEPKVYRITKPRYFSEEELKEVIASGRDNRHNSLILDLKGYFQLLSFEEARAELAPIAVRYETFAAGNGYVGKKAAEDGTI